MRLSGIAISRLLPVCLILASVSTVSSDSARADGLPGASAFPQVVSSEKGLSASFTVTDTTRTAGQGYVLFGSGPGCSGLVNLASEDSGAGTNQHIITVTGNDLAGTIGNVGIVPGATYSYEVKVLGSQGVEVDNNNGQCYRVTIPTAASTSIRTQFIRGTAANPVVESPDFRTVTMPLYTGTAPAPAGGMETVYYVLTDTTNAGWVATYGLNTVPKLANAIGSGAVQPGSGPPDHLTFVGNVDFSPDYTLVGNDAGTGFPPKTASPGAVGDARYSPLVQLGDDVIDAPIVGNPHTCVSTGNPDHAVWADKVTAVDCTKHTVTYKLTAGFFGGSVVHYASFDVSVAVGAALEDATLAPNLGKVPAANDSSVHSAREGIIGFSNGQTGAANVNRQGLNSAILDHLNPLNVVQHVPSSNLYSPIWELRIVTWTAQAVQAGLNTRQTDYDTIKALTTSSPRLATGTGPDGAFAASGPVPNCPLFSLDPQVPADSILGAP